MAKPVKAPEGAVQPAFNQSDKPATELAKILWCLKEGTLLPPPTGGAGWGMDLKAERTPLTKGDKKAFEVRVEELKLLVSDDELKAATENLEHQLEEGDYRAGDPGQKDASLNKLLHAGYMRQKKGLGPVHYSYGELVDEEGTPLDSEGEPL